MRLDRQELVGQKDVNATVIYTYVLNRGGKGPIALLIAYRAAEIDCRSRQPLSATKAAHVIVSHGLFAMFLAG
jgi:hypothetical protein